MSLVDKYFKETLKELLKKENSTEGEKVRPKYKDGTIANTFFLTNKIFEYDINKGEFPILSLRKQAWKSAINEIFAIYQTQTISREGFEKHGIKWWESWMNKEGNIGKAYSYNLESHNDEKIEKNVIKIKKRIIKKEDEKIEIKLEEINKENKDELVGKKIKNAFFGDFLVLDVYKTGTHYEKSKSAKIQYINTGYKTICQYGDAKRGRGVRDRELKKYYGFGNIGEPKNIKYLNEKEKEWLKQNWTSIMERCYNKKAKAYKRYGEKGVFVSKEWRVFENFLKTIKDLPNFKMARNENFKNWNIDKDYFGSNCYSKETCVWLKEEENQKYKKTSNVIKITKNEKEKIVLTATDATRETGICNSAISRRLKNEKSFTIKGVKFEEIKEENYVYRYELSRNQVDELIKNIKERPMGRRHIMSFWNWLNINEKNLVECAYETIWNVRGEFLDVILTQRSSDFAVAWSINEIQYVALQMMIAKTVGLKPGKFTHIVGNLHIYDRHLEQCEEMLKRKESETEAKIMFNPKTDDFYEFGIEDFEVKDYSFSEPQLKLELAM